MLELKNIVKIYGKDENKVTALKGIDVTFPETGIISILGASGCGKTTLLNIIGGLDRYSSGDLIINGISTKEYTNADWNTYRNHNVGFVFQNYYLIPHLNVLENVMIALNLSGLSPEKQKERAISVLKKVGLENQLKKKPKQLSGGQAQRVAIARAIANSPKIILADEPTGALDSENSEQVLNLLKELSKEAAVIIVTHNGELAEKYSNRIIKMRDGQIIDDETLSDAEKNFERHEIPKQKSKQPTMGLWAAFKTSIKNLSHKKGRTIMTSFAGCLGVISISIILALNSGFTNYAETFRKNSLAKYPITVHKSQSAIADIEDIVSQTDFSNFATLDAVAIMDILGGNKTDLEKYTDEEKIYIEKLLTGVGANLDDLMRENDTTEFKKYIDTNFQSDLATVKYDYDIEPYLYKTDKKSTPENPSYTLISPFAKHVGDNLESLNTLLSILGLKLSSKDIGRVESALSNIRFWDSMVDNQQVLDAQYKLLAGNWPNDKPEEGKFEVVIVVDEYNRITDCTLYALGYVDLMDLLQSLLLNSKDIISKLTNTDFNIAVGKELQLEYDFKDFIGHEFRLLLESDYYIKNADGLYENKDGDKAFINSLMQNAPTVTVSGIVQLREGVDSGCINADIGYSQSLVNYIINGINSSPVVTEQIDAYNDYLTAISTPEYAQYTDLIKKITAGEITVDSLTDAQKLLYATQSAVCIKSKIAGRNDIFNESSYETLLLDLGVKNIDSPEAIFFYPTSLEAVDKIEEYINSYNTLKENEYETGVTEKKYTVEYTNELDSIMNSLNSVINTITYILIAVTCLAIVVSLFMVGIIMYISVQDRTKEIGILRSIGARQTDIMNIFNTETMLLGFLSGIIGVAISYALMPVANIILSSYLGIANLVQPIWWHSLIIVVCSVVLTAASGLFPAILAAKKDPVIALRSE